MRVYLAGPEVFLPDAAALAARKVEICGARGLTGVFPADGDGPDGPAAPRETARGIYRRNRDLMDGCDAMIANMTPFRGPSMDVGTAFELGYMAGMGKPVLGYSNVTAPYATRTRAFFGLLAESGAALDALADPSGMAIEPFGMVDNLMLESAVLESGFDVVTVAVMAPEALYRDLRGFTACVERLAAR